MQRLKNLNPASEERTRIITGVPKSGRSVRMIPMNQDIEKLCNKWSADDLEAICSDRKSRVFPGTQNPAVSHEAIYERL